MVCLLLNYCMILNIMGRWRGKSRADTGRGVTGAGQGGGAGGCGPSLCW